MSALLLEQEFSGATTAIVVGRVTNLSIPALAGCERVLWFVDDPGESARPAEVRAGALQIFSPDSARQSNLVPLLEDFVLHDSLCLPHLFVTDAVVGPALRDYEPVIEAVHAVFESTRRVRQTRQQEGFLWQKQLLLNLPDFVRHRFPASWAGRLEGLPAFVCGAGPSLDVSATVLSRLADQGIVLAADSALRTLARHGVQADFAVSVDATKPPEKCLGPDVTPARVVLAGISPPAWRECEAEFRLTFLSGRSLTEQWLASLGVGQTPIEVVENCGITALEIARFLGCAPIFLFGMDLAADSENPGRKHASDADPGIDRGAGFDKQDAMPMVPGNYVDAVPTFLFKEWRLLNERIGSYPQGLLVNVNDRGARLGNATLVRPEDLGATECERNKRSELARLPPPTCIDESQVRTAFAELGARGARGCREIGTLRHALEGEGVDALVRQLRTLFSDEAFGRAMGAFSLKLMPHLAGETNREKAFWAGLLDELEELCCLAEALYEYPHD